MRTSCGRVGTSRLRENQAGWSCPRMALRAAGLGLCVLRVDFAVFPFAGSFAFRLHNAYVLNGLIVICRRRFATSAVIPRPISGPTSALRALLNLKGTVRKTF